MQRNLKTILIIGGILLLWRISQIIFGVLYSTNNNNYLGIPQGNRVDTIAPSGWYFEQHLDSFTSSKPSLLKVNRISSFQDQCAYGQGNCYAFLWQKLISSFRWISAIQYIAQAVNTNEPSDITNRFASLSDIQPKRYYPYILIQYLGNPSKESSDQEHAKTSRDNTIALGEKGIRYYCDSEKIKRIEQLDYPTFIKALQNKDLLYRYPCIGGELAHTLAFNYYYYLGDGNKSSLYYKVASFHDDVPAITSSMPAIIQGKEGNNKTSAYLRYDQWSSAANKYKNKENLNADEIASLESSMDKSLKKMVSEYSLYLLNQASMLSQQQWGEESCSTDYSCLQSQWYLKQSIQTINTTCTTNPIDCIILSRWEKKKWITPNGILSYPDQQQSINLFYIWDEEKSLREIQTRVN